MTTLKTKIRHRDGTMWSVEVPKSELDTIKAKWDFARTAIRFVRGLPVIDIKVSNDQKKWVLYKTLKGQRESQTD